MNLIQFVEPISVNFRKSAGSSTVTFEAGRDYLITDAQLERILKDDTVRSRYYKLSKTQTRFTNFNVGIPRNGTVRLLLFNGAGGYGDHIMTWPVAKILHGLGYEIHVACDPGNNVCWWNFPWIKSVNIMPMLYEHVKLYDYFLNFEVVTNNDEHQDQLHPVDTLLKVLGINPDSIDPAFKLLRPNFTYGEAHAALSQFQAKMPVALYQLSAANPVRCLPPNDSAFLAVKLAEEFSDMHWLCLYDEFVNSDYVKALACPVCNGTGIKLQVSESGSHAEGASTEPNVETCPECQGHKHRVKNLEPYQSPGLRELWGLSQHASVIVGPDSMMVHVAGVLEVPCVGLWGPVHPHNRVRYYKNHTALYHREFCPFSPCYSYTATFPKLCPSRPSPRTVCECLAGISATEVIDAVRKTRRMPPKK